jgi:phage FluMu protein Com
MGTLNAKGRSAMDPARCSHCNKKMKAVLAENGRTEFKCLKCDLLDPLQTDAVKWAESPLATAD